MKKIILYFLYLSASILSIHAQTIPNPGFENWSQQGPFESPTDWAGSPAASKSSDKHSGSFALQLKTDTFTNPMNQQTDTLVGMVNIGSRGMGPGAAGTSGYAFTARPDSLTGWFKYTPIGQEQFAILVTLSKWNTASNVREYICSTQYIGGAAANYTRFSFPLDYSSASTPDSLDIRIVNGDPQMKVMGTLLTIDDLAFVSKSNVGLNAIFIDKESTSTCYPNPANNQVVFSNLHSESIVIFNALGERLRSISTNGLSYYNFDSSELPAGLYIVQDSNGTTKQLVINR